LFISRCGELTFTATENFFLDFTYTFSVFVFVFSQLVNLDEKVRKKNIKIGKRDYEKVCPAFTGQQFSSIFSNTFFHTIF